MTDQTRALTGADIFDGTTLHRAHAVLMQDETCLGMVPETDIPSDTETQLLDGGTLAPGYVDLQVNGGDGILFNDDPTATGLARIAAAHAPLGTTSILPTLITDTADQTQAAIDAAVTAINAGTPGIAGLHLEGPHLSVARKGAHDPSLIRPMDDADMARLLDAAARLPVLKVTIAPENVRPDQMRQLADAGVLLSLGHTDTSYDTARRSADHGARCVTHLFNAMSQLGNREPGVVGAALDDGRLSAGLIADTIHVHPASIAAALRAKRDPGQVFLVSDAMAVAGSDLTHFTLNGRCIERHNGHLTLADGTLAGADLDLTTAIRNLVAHVALPLEDALAMATSIPADLIGQGDHIGRIRKGARADFVHLGEDLTLQKVWQGGRVA